VGGEGSVIPCLGRIAATPQDILRHDDLSTTQSAYQHIDAEEHREQLDSYPERSNE
jgi:integrase